MLPLRPLARRNVITAHPLINEYVAVLYALFVGVGVLARGGLPAKSSYAPVIDSPHSVSHSVPLNLCSEL
ncbi:hypothetical protein CBM2626_A60336 [Cupriavidus taiwanensis]|nr:hypothetical protein CBM2626_A60336 [Cupriavidus taiwanensis]